MLKPDRLLSLIEQGLISAANFAAMLVLARTLPGPSFGVFSFAWLTLLFMVNLHRSAVVVPFVIHTAGPGVLDSEGPLWRRLNAWATGLAAGGLGAAGGLATLAGPSWIGQGFAIGAVLILPAFWYEFRRRWSIQRDRYLVAVTAAAVYAGVAVGGAAAAGWSGRLDVATAAFALANVVACAVCTFGAPMPKAKVPPPPFRSFLSRLAHFIGWSVMSNLAYNGYNHLPPLLLGLLAGPVPVAVYQAARNLVQPLSTLASAVDNFDKPRAARALANSGVPGMAGALGRTTLALILGSAPYLVLLLAMGGPVTRLVYGDRFPTATAAMPWFAAMQVTMIAAYPLETALFIVRRPDLLFWGRVLAAAAAIALCVTLIPGHGLDGAMAGLVGGMAVSAVAAAFNLLRDRSWIR